MYVQRQIEELLALRASEWFELLPTASEADLRGFDAWLSESRLHVQEFLEIAEVDLCLQNIDPERRENIELLLQRIAPRVAILPKRTSAGPFLTSDVTHRRWKFAGAAAAAFASLAVIAALLFREPGAAQQYATAVGEQRIVELPDTSVVTMNADTEIEVRLRDSEREIELRHGEAVFEVAHDASRPFSVHTRAGVAQAVGTHFNVQDRVNGDTRVSVLEGRVRLTAQQSSDSDSQGRPAELMLVSGEEADIRLDGTIQRHEHAIVANTVAWRQRRLVFDNAPLEEMISEFNRYNRSLRLRLDGVSGDVHRYDGIFDATDPESFVELLSREPDLKIERREGEIVVRPSIPAGD